MFDYQIFLKDIVLQLDYNFWYRISAFIGSSLYFLVCFGNTRIVVQSLPSNTPVDARIFIAGNFNLWNPGHTDFELRQDASNTYYIDLDIPSGSYQYKFTRGSWATVEGNAQGGFRPNRTLVVSGRDTVIYVEVLSWEDLGSGG